ncbi:N-acetylglucosamine-6-phosphate deacetylase [Herbiconiux sp. YIM B11900]|uniref:N-acetylglucosamine-6-phosphate deacetylase n=1 Tax=Herbiconiux sp. YIM B11900 TaxID=3404131 RepID=UPI003F834073
MSLAHASVLVHSAQAIDAGGIVDDAWVLASDDRIVESGTGSGWRSLAAEIGMHGGRGQLDLVDGSGLRLVPGFIDLHAHGGGGHAFDDGAAEIAAAVAVHRTHGTTRSVISLVANPLPALEQSLGAVASLAEGDPLVLGAHLEGPFLAPSRKGAHNPSFLIAPTPDAVSRLIEAGRGHLRQVTVAPELPGALDAIDRFVAAGVVVAVGHTEATAEQAHEAFDHGATLLTHAFNAMPGLGHREPGPVAAALADPRVVLELIVDGVHVHPDVVRLAFGAAPGRIALITDAMAAAGSRDGRYRLGTLDVEVANGRAVLAGTSTIAGSTLTLDAALRTATAAAGIDVIAAIPALTATPARVLGRAGDLGLLRPGHAADLVLLTPDGRPRHVFAAGARIPTPA